MRRERECAGRPLAPVALGACWALLVTGLLILGSHDAQGSQDPGGVSRGEAISLSEAVRQALSRHPSLKEFGDRIQVSKERVGESRSGYFPTLSASYSDTVGNSVFGYFLFPAYEYANYNLLTVSLTQTILDFGRVGAHVREGLRKTRALEAERRRKIQAVILDVETSYYALLTAQRRIVSARQSLLDARSHLEEALARVSAGAGTRLDVTQALVNRAQARLDLIREEEGIEKDRLLLGRSMGLRGNNRFVAVDPATAREDTSVDPEKDLARRLLSHPELQADRETIRSREASLDSALDQNYPSVSGSAQYYLAQVSVAFLPGMPTTPFSTVNVGGMLNIPIFEGGLVTHQVHEARAILRQSIHRKEDDEVRIEAKVRMAGQDVREAIKRLKETRRTLDNARENDRLVEESYRIGAARSVDVTDAEISLRRARVEVDSARYDIEIALARYRFALGMLAPPPPGQGNGDRF